VAQETEQQAFIRKLCTFRVTLSPIEARALDTILRTAEKAKPVGDVEAHGWFFGPGTDNSQPLPDGTDVVAPGETTGWWQMYSSGNNPFRS